MRTLLFLLALLLTAGAACLWLVPPCDPQLGGTGSPPPDLRPAADAPIAGAAEPPPAAPAADSRQRTGGSARGRTLRRNGGIVPGARVRSATGIETLSDPGGCFELRGLGDGLHILMADADGLVGNPATILVRGATAVDGVDLVLDPAHFLAGTVRSAAGAALAGARVSGASRLAGSSRGGAPITTSTDAHGQFRLGPFAPGPVELLAEHPAHLAFARLYATDAPALSITLKPSGNISGVVLDPSGCTATAISTVLVLAPDAGRPTWRVIAEHRPDPADAAAGRFLVPVSTARAIRIHVSTLRFGPAVSEVIQVTSGAPHGSLQLRAVAAAEVNGRIVDEIGDAVVGASIEVRAQHMPFAAGVAQTDVDGAFGIGGLAHGRHTLRVRASGCADLVQTFDVGEGAAPTTVRCRVTRGAALAGRIRMAAGATLSPLQVLAVRDDRPAGPPTTATVRGDAYGFDWLAPGTYRLTLRGPGDPNVPTGATVVQVARGDDLRLDLDLRTLGMQHLHGRVRCDGTAAAGATIEVSRPTGRSLIAVPCDDFGRFAIDGLPPDSLELMVRRGNGPVLARRALSAAELAAGDLQIDVHVGALAGRVVTPDGDALAEADVRVLDASDRVLASTRSDPGGWFRVPEVAAGEWSLMIRPAGASIGRRVPVHVAAGVTCRLPVVFP